MSECEDMTTMMAKELTLGIKDTVEDVSAMFKRMALLKPQTSAWSIFSEHTQPQDNTPLLDGGAAEPALEFTFGAPASSPAAIFQPESITVKPTKTKPAARKGKTAEISEDQFLLFKIA